MTTKKYLNPLYILVMVLSMLMFSTVSYAAEKTPEQIQKQDLRYKGLTEKQIEKISNYLEQDNRASAERALNQANIYINKISETFMATPEGQELKKNLDQMEEQLAAAQVAHQELVQNDALLAKEQMDFNDFIGNNGKLFELLMSAKNSRDALYTVSLERVDLVDQYLPELMASEAEFRQSFPNLIEQKPEYQGQSFATFVSVADVLDIFQNGKQYRNSLVEVAGNATLDAFFEELKAEEEQLTKFQVISQDILGSLYSKESNQYFNYDKVLKPYYDSIPKALPAKRMQRLADYKVSLRTLVESTAKTGIWEKKEFPMRNAAMKKVAQAVADKKGWTLVEYGAEETAYIVRNVLDIPTHQLFKGKVVFHVDGEPVNRGYRVSFIDPYDGNEYRGISEVADMFIETRPMAR